MLLSNGFDPDPRVLEEARGLVSRGYRVSIVGWDRDGVHPPEEVMDGVRVRRITVRSTHGRGRGQTPYLLAFWWSAFRLAVGRGTDLFWCHDLDTLPLGSLLKRLTRRPLVFDAHESYPDMVAASIGPIATWVLRRLERALVRRVDAIVTVGRRLAGHFQKMGARRVVVAGNWKRPEQFVLSTSRRNGVRRTLGVPEKAFVLSNIGWLSAERQLLPLLTAVRADPDVWLLLGGRGPMEEVCRRAAAECPRIRFMGWVDADRIPEVTASADAVYYGFDPANGNARFSAPNKLFEALAAGIPVVTGPFGEIEEIVRSEGCGVVLDHYDSESVARGIRELMTGEEQFTEGSYRARKRYTRARADDEIRRLVEELLPKRVGFRGAVPALTGA